jgi:hypothetical protein
MKKLAVSLLALGLNLISSASYAQSDVFQAVDDYLSNGRLVLNELARGKPEANAIEQGIDNMLQLAIPVIGAFASVKPQCQKQLDRMIELFPEIDQWSAQDIRLKIEAAQGLPAAEGCYAARDVVAHPAIVRALVRKGFSPDQQLRLVREMDEAMEHMEELRLVIQPQKLALW